MSEALTQILFDRRRWIAWLVLALGLAMTALASYGLYVQDARNARRQFDLHVKDVVAAVETRLRDHEQILLGGAGLFDALGTVSRKQWWTYVHRLRLSRNYPGILGVGYSEVIAPSDLERHIAALRAEGFPGYTVKPAGKRDLYTAIVYLEPFSGRNLAAFGYDMFSEPTRRAAMEQAVNTGKTAISGRVRLVQETHGNVQAGFLMYVPIYQPDLPVVTASERWQALKGFVYSPYRVDDLMQGLLGTDDASVDFRIDDGRSAGEDSLMYASAASAASSGFHPWLSSTRHMQAFGRDWTLTFFSRPDFEAKFASRDPWLVALLGGVLSVSLYLLIGALIGRQVRARTLAEEMTARFRENEARLAEINERFNLAADAAGLGVWEYDLGTNSLFWDERMYRLYGVDAGDFEGCYDAWISRVHPEDRDGAIAAQQASLAEGKNLDLSFRVVHKDGAIRHIRAVARILKDMAGKPLRLIGINLDVTEQMEAEGEVRRSRRLLADVLKAASEFSIIATDPQGLITIFNRGAESILGYSAEDIVGKRTPAIFHLAEEVEARGKELSKQLGTPVSGFRVFVELPERQGAEQRTWTYVRKDGGRVPVSLVVTTMREEGGEIVGYLGIAQDISERLRVERSLLESGKRFRSLFELSPFGIALNDQASGRFLEVNDALIAPTGYSRDEFLALSYWDITPREYEAQEQLQLEIMAATGHYGPYEKEYIRKDGSRYPVLLNGFTTAGADGRTVIWSIVQDITERKQAEAAFRQQADHTRAILENVLDGIITIDGVGIVSSFNKAAEHIFGYVADEVVGRNVKMLMPEPYHSNHDDYLHNYHATGVARVIGIGREVEGRRKDGDIFPLDLAVSEITYNGRPLFIGIVRDITERKRMDRMKSEFVSTVSHELRTPLTSIAGALGLLTGVLSSQLPEQARQLLDIAHKNSQRLAHLIDDLLDMEKIAVGKMRFDMQVQTLMPLVEQALEANRAYGEQYGVSFFLVQSVEGVEVRVDGQRILQVLSNFLSNAAKFSPPEGKVEVAVKREKQTVRVEVADHGPGIPPEFQTRIFQKFSQADSSDTRQKGGTGLGLAITKELVERMGGRIGFHSRPGEGATFFFELPVFECQMPEGERPVATDSSAPRILVVEDEPDIARLLAMMLTRAGYLADVAEDGGRALQLLERRSYAAMTLDLILPDISGLEVIRRVRHRQDSEHLPIIVVSAKMEEGRLAINGDFSAIDWLPKPVDDARLLAAVEKVLPAALGHRPRVLHVEDDADLHQVVRSMVKDRFDFDLAQTLADAGAMLALERYDVVILDLGLPDGSGWDLLPRLRELVPPPRVIILSGAEVAPEDMAKVEAALLKESVSPRMLLDALSARIGPATSS